MNVQPVSYLQTDPRWKNKLYAVKGEKSTIGGSGCGPTAMAMVLATWADKTVTPETECAWALKNGYKCLNSGTFYSYFVPAARRYGLKCTMLNGASLYKNSKSSYHDQAKAAVQRGDLVIACMGKGNWTSSGHYILLWDIRDDIVTAFINDPASTKLVRTHGDYNLFKTQVKYYWVIENPNTAVTPTDYDVKIMDKTGLNCRDGAGTGNKIVKTYLFGAVIHISKVTSTGWGYTGEGWINLTNTVEIDLDGKNKEELNMTKKEFIESLTGEEAYDLVNKALNYMGDREEPGWSKSEGAWQWAVDNGIVNGGAPERPIKRDEFVAVLHRILTKLKLI